MEVTSPRKHKPKVEGEFHKRRKRLIPPVRVRPAVFVIALVVVLGIWLLPALVGHTGLVSWIANRSAAELNGRIVVQSASLGWFSPVSAYGVKIVDQEDREVIEVPEVHGDRVLVGLLWNAAHVGRFRLVGPKVTVVLRDDGSNVEDVLANYLVAKKRKKIDIAVEVVDGSVSIEEARTRRTWQVDNLQVDFALPADRSRPVELKTSGTLAGAERGGGFEVAMRIGRDRSGQDAPADPPSAEAGEQATEPSGLDSVTAKAEGFSLAVFEPLVRRALPGTRLAGRLTAALQCTWDSRRPDGRATLQANATAEELKLSGPLFGKDQPSLARVQVRGAAAWEKGCLLYTSPSPRDGLLSRMPSSA